MPMSVCVLSMRCIHTDEKLGTFAGHPSCVLTTVAFRIPERPKTASPEAPAVSAQPHPNAPMKGRERQKSREISSVHLGKIKIEGAQ